MCRNSAIGTKRSDHIRGGITLDRFRNVEGSLHSIPPLLCSLALSTPQLVVYQSPDPTTKTHFPCHQWLSRQEGDGSTKRVLIPSAPSPRSLGKNYLVTTKTGGMRGAGTDANVFVTLYGSQGCSGRRRLDNNVENFERGRSAVDPSQQDVCRKGGHLAIFALFMFMFFVNTGIQTVHTNINP